MAITVACEKSLIQGIQLPNDGPRISHLLYADDAIFTGIWDRGSIKNLSRILKCFQICLGLKINFHKSRLFGISTSDVELENMAQILGCSKSTFPFTYLGVLVGDNMLLKKTLAASY